MPVPVKPEELPRFKALYLIAIEKGNDEFPFNGYYIYIHWAKHKIERMEEEQKSSNGK